MKCETRACSAIGCICNTLQGTDNDVRKTDARGAGTGSLSTLICQYDGGCYVLVIGRFDGY